jgi:glycosyltransferase involved in cell wall biosynthesis
MNNLNVYFNSPNLKIFYLEGNINNSNFLEHINNNCYIFYQFTWNIDNCVIENNTGFLRHYESNFMKNDSLFNFKTNFIFCSPNENANEFIIKNGYSSIILNHNSFLDYKLYSIGNTERIYNAVINSRPFWWKRVYLASKVDNLIYIKGSDWANNETSWDGYKSMDCVIKSCISQSEVNKLYKESNCGLILSGNTGENQQGLCEGSNYSTGEYLLCGLPVVSTPNQGGRNYWLDTINSIFCEPNENDIKDSVNKILNKIKNNEICRKKIRDDCIDKINALRYNFIKKTNELFIKHNVDIDAFKHFEENFFHKMCNYNFDFSNIDKLFDV